MKLTSEHDLQLGHWLAGAALGAVAMYLLDPDRGAPRRALSGDKLRRLGRQTGHVIDQVVHDVGARAQQAVHATPALEHAIGAPADQLSTPRGMRGATLAGASVLGLGGLLAPRSPVGMAMGLAGLALLVRASGRHPARALLAAARHTKPVALEKTVHIDAAPEQVFDLFAKVDNFPRFMANVLEVRDLGGHRSHWVVKGPAGTHFAWNAVLTEFKRPHKLAWESEAGAQVEQSGVIRFEPVHDGTRVTVRMSYRPPAGAVGHALASLLGRDPGRQMDDDLARMKALVERGSGQHGAGEHKTAAHMLH
jgi:uncharacterized membrane protein